MDTRMLAEAANSTSTGSLVALSEAQALMMLLPIGVVGLLFGIYQIMWLKKISLAQPDRKNIQ